MRDIILIQPKTRWSEQITRRHPLSLPIPISLLMISSYIKDKYNVIILDQRIEKNWEKKLVRLLGKKPLMVGISAMTGRQLIFALQASKIVKDNSDVPVVWGGPHPSILPEQTVSHELVDYVIHGEGEHTIYDLAVALESKKEISGVHGIGYMDGNKVRINSRRQFLSMDELPPLPFGLLDMRKYFSDRFACRPIGIPSTRGCPNKCKFCYDTYVHSSCWRSFSAERTLKEIDRAVKIYGANYIYFFESNSMVDVNRMKKIAKGIIKGGYDITWEALAEIKTLRNLDYEFFALMEKSGMRDLRIGIESGSPRVLKLINKDLTPHEAIRVNKMLSKFNIKPSYSFLNGFPTETDQELKMSVNLMFRLKKDNPNAQFGPINTLMPYPGTEIYDMAVKNGFRPPEKLEGWFNIDSFDVMHKEHNRMPWIGQKKAKRLEKMFYLSLFMDEKSKTVDNKLLNLVVNAYRPLARFRLRRLMIDFMPEYSLYKLFSASV